MSPWDGTKTTEDGDGTVNADEQLTASEWNNHVTDGHFPSDKLNLGTDVNGDPVMTDPANGDQVVLRYDPGAGQWEIVNVNLELNSNDITGAGALNTEEADIDNTTINNDEYLVEQLASGSTHKLSSFNVDSEASKQSIRGRGQFTVGVGTSAVPILATQPLGGPAFIAGSEQGTDGKTAFADIINHAHFGDATTVQGNTRESPAGRTYSISGGNVQLAMGSDTYDVAAYSFSVRGDE